MSVIHMRHPRHGTKVATLDAEAKHDEKHGWERYDPTHIDVAVELPAFLSNTNKLTSVSPGRGKHNRH